MSVYGHRLLSFIFRPLIAVNNDGFLFKGRKYSWDDVKSIDITSFAIATFFVYPAGMPRATISLRDGNNIHLNGRVFEKEGERPKVGFFSSKSDAFDEIISVFKRNAL